ncbi:unnamed protein product [Adineta steineri]|uniref:SAM-dependent methyltransferase n=1 Tax=Adineta steineri TaxID=433720 RepID=A0A815QCK7_9BILA|nr:unnamed protein product [Adineta steineri]CAF3927882.1 unnamed protein product [Adineta steineri]
MIAMRGNGYYSKNTVGAKLIIDIAGDFVMNALSTMNLSGWDTSFSIADFGAADGGTSLDLMRRIVKTIRAADMKKAITITYTDLPQNDFSALFHHLHHEDHIIPLGREPNVYTFASGTTFYRQIFPDNTLSLGFSATAMHWLSERPSLIADHVHVTGANQHERELFRRQANIDWETILLARARELVSGGILILANFCIDDQGRYLGASGDSINMFDWFTKHWRKLMNDGIINESEYHRGTFQQYYRTINEFTALFHDENSLVRRTGLVLKQVSTHVTKCPYAAQFREHGDATAFAKAYIPTLRSWSESTFLNALDLKRTSAERQTIIDRFYQAMENDVTIAPKDYSMDYVHCFLTIVKQ